MFEMNSSATSASSGGNHQKYQAENGPNSLMTSGPNATQGSENDTYATSRSISGVTEEASIDTKSPITHTKAFKSPFSSSNPLPFTASVFFAETRDGQPAPTLLFNNTEQNPTSPLFSLPFSPWEEAKKTFQDPKPPTVPVTKNTSLDPENSLSSSSSTVSQMSLIKDVMGSQPTPQPQNPHFKPLLHFQTSSKNALPQHQTSPSKAPLQLQTVTSQTFPFHKSQTSLLNRILLSKTSMLQSSSTQVQTLSLQPVSQYPENSPSESSIRQEQTSAMQPQLQQLRGQAIILERNQHQSDTPHKALSILPEKWGVGHDFLSSPSPFFTRINQLKTTPTPSDPPSPSPISSPPHSRSVQPVPLTTSTIPSLNSSHYPSSIPFFSSVHQSTSSPPMTNSQIITSSSLFLPSSTTIPSLLSSSIDSTASSISSASSPSSPHSSSFISTYSSISIASSTSAKLLATSSTLVSSQSASPHPEPSPAPRRSLYHPLTSTSSPLSSQRLTPGQRLLIQSHIKPSDPKPILNLPTPTIIVHSNPEPHPNLDPNFKQNFDHKFKTNHPNINMQPKHPTNPSGTPDKEGKYPNIIPRHSAWELGMLLGCSAGLGMALVVGLRYLYRKACGKRTEVTLNDREREYGRGERGLIHVQECGDLVRVRRIRDNSFVLLAEYDILASPGD